jgi:hypothetical protein
VAGVWRGTTARSSAPEPLGGGRRAKLADHAERVHALLAAAPDSTIAELRSRLAAAGIAGSPAAISRFLNACGLTRKQSPRTPPSRSVHRTSPPRGTPDAQQGALSPERLVFIDNETGPPPRSRAAMAGPPAGGACRCRPPRPLEGHDFIAALRDG